jgi:hypothetical protein
MVADPDLPTPQKSPMTKRRLIWVTVLAFLTLGGSVAMVILPGDRITLTNCARIKMGMEKTEVLAILGPPTEPSEDEREAVEEPEYAEYWEGLEAYIFVFFDRNDVVTYSTHGSYSAPTHWERLNFKVKHALARLRW